MPSQKKYAFIALFTLSICILALYIQRHRQGRTGRIDNWITAVTGSVQEHFLYLSRGVRSVGEDYVLLVHAKKENAELEKEVGSLRSQLAQMQEISLENQRLRDSLAFRDKIPQKLIAANVVAHDVSSDYYGIRIDKGSKDGIAIGMGVTSQAGVVGRVLRVSSHYADVQTLVDPTSNIDVLIQRSRARGILSGQSKQLTCKMKYVDRLEDVAVGDTVVSSDYNSIFPKGLLVGYVTSVIPNPNGILQTVTVKSAVDIFRLEEVFVVFPSARTETAAN